IDGWEPASNHKERRTFAICRASGLLATQECPAHEVEHRTYEVYPTKNGEWVRSTKDPQPPTRYCDQHKPTLAAPQARHGDSAQ
ncbi:MAG: hypothetical protein QME94_10520, partial [Anaerolineae bacterium]|nr:hypothetical protein [Anaerolineae bacterium]